MAKNNSKNPVVKTTQKERDLGTDLLIFVKFCMRTDPGNLGVV
jgi:hypothetical protein